MKSDEAGITCHHFLVRESQTQILTHYLTDDAIMHHLCCFDRRYTKRPKLS